MSKTFWLVFAMGSPENVEPTSSYASVKWIRWLGCGERWMLGNHHKQDNGCGKNINLLARIRLIQVDLRGHVVHGSELSGQISTAVSSIDRASKPKVCNFNIIKLIKQ